ncbi:helix-turn-helix transcriptional regulator [Aeromonas veronii]|uniref:helix-turn-helix transcriptional regulator n=1 Tax=Aeromonas TaxID=642 RepID=UPI0025826258|nr:AlpA family transcriptional regulator [Aeromonas sp.]MCX7132418.1 AlpA family transcriptional regulator [Aeromonas sp.]
MTNQTKLEQNSQELRFIRVREAVKKTGLSKSTIYDLMASGRFPQSVRLSARTVAFIESEVDQWMVDRVTAARGTLRAA